MRATPIWCSTCTDGADPAPSEPAIEFQAGFISKSGKALPRIAEMLIEKARELEREPTAV